MRLLFRLLKLTVAVLVVLVVWLAFRANASPTVFRREIVVNVPPQVAWDFGRPKQWVSWLGEGAAPRQVGSTDVIGPDSTATFAGGFQFRMSEFAPHTHWIVDGPPRPDDDRLRPSIRARQRPADPNGLPSDRDRVWQRRLRRPAGTLASFGHQAALNRLADEINRLPEAN